MTFNHQVHESALEEKCKCGNQATHKVAEEMAENRHPFTTYVCCRCFGRLFGPVAVEWCEAQTVEFGGVVAEDDRGI